MKKCILLVFVLTLLWSVAYAESNSPSIGIVGGLNLSNVGGKSNSKLDPTPGFRGGATMLFPVVDVIVLQAEMNLTMKGTSTSYKDTYDGYPYDVDITDTYTYLEAPLLMKLNLELKPIQIQPYIGASLAYLLGASTTTTVTMDYDSESESASMKQYMNNVDAGINIGMDIIVFDQFMAGLRYNYGLLDIYDKDYPGLKGYKNRTFMLNFGYVMKLNTLLDINKEMFGL